MDDSERKLLHNDLRVHSFEVCSDNVIIDVVE